MILYYAVGGGLGHLSRAKKILDHFNINHFKVLSASSSAEKVFTLSELIIIPQSHSKNDELLKVFYKDIFNKYPVTTFFIDTFPLGIIGEFNDFDFPKNLVINYVARNLKWESYLDKVRTPFSVDKTYYLEALEPQHEKYIDKNSKKSELLKLKVDLIQKSKFQLLSDFELPEYRELWLVVHSSDKEELKDIIDFAIEIKELEKKEPYLLIISDIELDQSIPECKVISYYPASHFFKLASKIFTACGFNLMQETLPYVEKHHFVPFNRKYDNQFLRAAERRKLKNEIK